MAYLVFGGLGYLGSSLVRHLQIQRRTEIFALDRLVPQVSGRVSSKKSIERQVDLSNVADVSDALTEILSTTQGQLNAFNFQGLVTNTPMIGSLQAEDTFAGWRSDFESNFFPVMVPTILLARAAATAGRECSIVQMSSISAKGVAGQSAYAAAKSAIEIASRSLAHEFGPLGIRINSVRVGYMDSPSLSENLSSEKIAGIKRRVSLRRLGESAELNELVLSIAENTFITGSIVDFDGGYA